MAARNRGTFRRLALGSVARTAVHQAARPALVVS
jgi:nucleotide-binding universal stress UspA family protein